MPEEADHNAWHSLSLEALYERVGSGEAGLESDEVSHRLKQQGRNTIRVERGAGVLQIVGHQIHNPLIYLLLGAAGVSLLGGHVVDAVVIGVVVVLNTLIGAAQEWKADKALDALRKMAAPKAQVLRDGEATEVLTEEIVPGDVLVLETGARVAADARLLESSELQADESALTGESEPVHLRPDSLDEATPMADRTNMVWSSTAITGGRGRAIVVATGMDTVVGRIAGDVQGTEREQTPLQRRLARLGAILGFAGIGLAGIVFFLGLLRGYDWLEMMLFSVAVAVSAIPEGEGCVLYVKGGADRVLSFCTHVLVDGQKRELTEELRAWIEQANDDFADDALRVLAGAVRSMPADAESAVNEDAENGLVFVGLWGLVDPARPEAIEAIAQAREAGIRVVMITGDHAATAAAIAREVGIASDEASRAVTGSEIDRMDDETLNRTASEVNVYARVSPSHKLRILKALKSHGEIVSMTGDGVNDAPALKGADIGVAMGRTGTEVAKEAADMVLTDDDFATIMYAVEEGRAIYANLRRVVFFLVTTNLGEIITLTIALLVGLPLPLTAVMILWINLVTDGACTIPLGIEPMHRDVLTQPPRDPKASILDRTLLRRMLILAPLMAFGTLGLFAYSLNNGQEEHAMTIAFTTLAAFQWFHGLNARTSRVSVFSVGLFSNPWLWFGIGLAAVLQVLAVHTGFGQAIFKTVPLSLADWGMILAVSSSILVVDEVLKALGLHGKDRATA